ncbi:MAG: Multiple sugar ABC transporter, membrane-spanning permease protein MsmF [uncultured Sphingomonas sp.]|uniref:Multiple sugar ABC transporter, membrane-spanning permease protein MsmF n=1 Tax=uncultured Sphingomonas sp. TaxID=158754 RepID=A0A6J4T7C5_9SPHN|nr:MAG: Multiple sugar ABC transporter, membrane-spanning permease protein MsmF [uncultured Sphingomonas sp.]
MSSARDWRGLLFVAPFLLLYSIILIFPLLRGMWLSLNQVDLFGAGHFVGLGNYARLLGDPIFGTSLLNTFKLTLLIVPVLTVLALTIALALNRAGGGAAILRGIFFSSAVLSVTIVTLIWRFVLAPDAGLLGEAWQAAGWDPLPFLSAPNLVLPALAITTIWWSLGLPMLLFLAGLQQIPQDMYEAAALDRAGKWTTFWRITLPALRRTLVLVVMLQTAAQLQIFGQAQLMTGGGPSGASRTAVLFLFETAFGRWELGYAAAAAEVLFLIILAVTLTQYWATGRATAAEAR